MRRLRVALALLLVSLAVPVSLLVNQALESARLEERVRHEAVSGRIFDEMERTLSDFLAREEARAPDDYRFYRWQSDDPRAPRVVRERSPLSRPANEPFVIAYFQIQPDGSLRTPLRPDDVVAAERDGDWPPADAEQRAVDRAVATLEREVAPFWRDAAKRRVRLANAAGGAVGDAEDLADPSLEAKLAPLLAEAEESPASRLERKPSPAADDDRQASALGLIESLNVATQKRAARRQQMKDAPRNQAPGRVAKEVARSAPVDSDGATDVFPLTSTQLPPATVPPRAAAAPRQEGFASRADFAEESDDPYLSLDALDTASASLGDALARFGEPDAPAESRSESGEVDVARIVLEPMAGHALGDAYLMLHRTVLVDGEGFRQGLLIDRAALGEWLGREVIGTGALASLARVAFGATPAGPSGTDADTGGHWASHRFADPFGPLTARLRVGPLRESTGTTVVLVLAGGLAVVALLGTWAVHRMVSVVVEFAERRSNFVAAVSHELKTPLTAIRMHGEMLRDGLVPTDAKRDDYYRTITDESERLSRLIDNVLEFSRLERGHRPLSTTMGSPAPVVQDIVDRLRPHAEREGFSLTSEIDEPTPSVRFDRDALAQMIFNLVDNAIKYAAESPLKSITVRCAATDDGGVVISVRDRGPGVPREQLGRIFEPFHRVEAELTRTTKGSGIGLSLVKQLGDAMGAVVTGECPDDGGFRVRIDFARAAV